MDLEWGKPGDGDLSCACDGRGVEWIEEDGAFEVVDGMWLMGCGM